jgi:hypothetical protein
MEIGWRGGGANGVSGTQESLGGGVKNKRESKLAHSEIFTDSTEVGAGGANG